MEYPDGFFDGYHAQKPICGVLSVAICAGVTYDVAHAACKRNLPEGRQRFGGRTAAEQREKALLSLGVKLNYVVCLDKPTLKEFVEQIAEPGIMYSITYVKHVVTLLDGFIIDQEHREHYLAWPKVDRVKVKKYFKIIGKGW